MKISSQFVEFFLPKSYLRSPFLALSGSGVQPYAVFAFSSDWRDPTPAHLLLVHFHPLRRQVLCLQFYVFRGTMTRPQSLRRS